MMRDYFKKRPDLSLSVALHVFFFLALFCFALLRSCSDTTPVHVFELTDLSDTPSGQEPAVVSPRKPPSQSDSMPPRRMQIADFLKEHPRSQKSAKPMPVPETVTASESTLKQFDALPKFKNEAIESRQNLQMTELERSALQAYGLSIYKKIRSHWNQPNIKTEKDLSVEVAFTVLANGMITKVELINPSNNTAFNRSILSVFKKLVRFQPTPSQKNEQFQMVFKVK